MKVNIQYPQAKCEYCNKTYEKKHGNQKYCSKECAEQAKEEQDRHHKLRWYYKNRDRINKTRIGTRNLSEHRHKDPEKEQKAVEYELKQLGIKI
jgi:hypothetical protein